MKGVANSIRYKIINKNDYKLIILIFTLLIINTNLFAQNGGNWTWIHGEHNDSIWSYGIKGVPSPNNMPPSRQNTGGSWIDKEGNFWMFSGYISNIHGLNYGATDLWRYSPQTNLWTWISGDTSSRYVNGLYSQDGVYGTKGIPSVNNYPISRRNSMCWTDTAGDLWLFGGEMASGCSNIFWCWTLNIQTLNDLWKYNIKKNEWTWVSGNNPYANVFTPMNRGIKGVEDTNNFPGVRSYTNCTWVDNDKLYFYGGVGQFDYHSDVWYYSISKNLWVWEGGLDIVRDTGKYGTFRIPDPSTRPNARRTELSCKYKNAIYIYSGESFGGLGVNNDLWKYDLNTHLWSWVDGKKTTKPYILDTGTPPSKNCDSSFQYPDTRDFHSTISANNLELKNFIMFGGRIAYSSDYHNDLWAYNLDSLKWKRISGNTNSLNKIGNWGLKNVTNSINEIYGVASAATWIDKNSNLYFFSGLGKQGCTNSLWKFEPDPKCIQFNNDTKLIKSVNDTSFCYNSSLNISFTRKIDSFKIYPTDSFKINNDSMSASIIQSNSGIKKVYAFRNNLIDSTEYTIIIKPNDTTLVHKTICYGSFFTFNGVDLRTEGIYIDTFQNTKGCDSFVMLDLKIEKKITDTIFKTLCYNSSYFFNNTFISNSGIYYDTLISISGCDSILVLNLKVEKEIADTIFKTLCHNSSYFFNNTFISNSGIYYDTLISINGCDSLLVLNLKINKEIADTIFKTLCYKTSYYFNNTFISNSGIYYDTLVSINGCDSILVLYIKFSNSIGDTINVSYCNKEPYIFNSNKFFKSGIYLDTLISSSGCDSFIVLNIKIGLNNKIKLENGINYTSLQDSVYYQWYRCNPWRRITNETNKTFTTKTRGSYAVVLDNGKGCRDTSDCIALYSSQISQLWGTTILWSVFPNPFIETFHVSLDKPYKTIKVKLYDLLGRLVISETMENNSEFNIHNSKLVRGSYYLQVETESSSQFFNLLKE